MLGYVACKEKRNKFLYYFTYFSIILYDFVNCPAFVDIKQTLHYKVAIEQIYQRDIYFLCIVPYVCFAFLCWIEFFSGCFRGLFFVWETKKKWSLVALDWWLSYSVTIVREFAWADTELVVLQWWLFEQV